MKENERERERDLGQITDANNSSAFASVEYRKILADLPEKFHYPMLKPEQVTSFISKVRMMYLGIS